MTDRSSASSSWWRAFWPSSEWSHSILSKAISHVSRTDRLGSLMYFFRIGMEVVADIAPIASAALHTTLSINLPFLRIWTYLMSDHRVFLLICENSLEHGES